MPKDENVREELLTEAEFYQVEGVVKSLRSSFFKDSVILPLEQRQTVVTWLEETGFITVSSEKVLYRASRNGWFASNFHSCCDNKGPTVTLVKSGNYIFGGYTDQSWDGGYFLSTLPVIVKGNCAMPGDDESAMHSALVSRNPVPPPLAPALRTRDRWEDLTQTFRK